MCMCSWPRLAKVQQNITNALMHEKFNITINTKQLNKDSNTTNTTVNSVGNKTDELKKVVENINKRVEKLEQK